MNRVVIIWDLSSLSWMITNKYSSPTARKVTRKRFYTSRVGWKNYSGVILCSVAVLRNVSVKIFRVSDIIWLTWILLHGIWSVHIKWSYSFLYTLYSYSFAQMCTFNSLLHCSWDPAFWLELKPNYIWFIYLFSVCLTQVSHHPLWQRIIYICMYMNRYADRFEVWLCLW